MPGCSGGPVVTTLVWLFFSHARLRGHWAPGIPHALYWAEEICTTRAHRAAGMRKHVIARSEATKQSILLCRCMDCFASLAMTNARRSLSSSPVFNVLSRATTAVKLARPGMTVTHPCTTDFAIMQ